MKLLDVAVSWATGKSKALKGEIEELRHEVATHEETIGQLQENPSHAERPSP